MKDSPIFHLVESVFSFVSIRNFESLPPFPRYLFYTVFAQQREITMLSTSDEEKTFLFPALYLFPFFSAKDGV